MAIKNLKLFLNKQEQSKVTLRTENGAEVVFDKFLVDELDLEKEIYLNLDNHPLSESEEQKQLLNELLDE